MITTKKKIVTKNLTKFKKFATVKMMNNRRREVETRGLYAFSDGTK
jgi:hypothetical protein